MHGASFDIGDWDPGRDEELLVPARVGTTLFFELDRPAESLGAYWLPPGSSGGAAIATAPGLTGSVRVGTPSCVRFDASTRGRARAGTLLVVAHQEFACAWVEVAPGRGTEDAPLLLELRPCGSLLVEVETD